MHVLHLRRPAADRALASHVQVDARPRDRPPAVRQGALRAIHGARPRPHSTDRAACHRRCQQRQPLRHAVAATPAGHLAALACGGRRGPKAAPRSRCGEASCAAARGSCCRGCARRLCAARPFPHLSSPSRCSSVRSLRLLCSRRRTSTRRPACRSSQRCSSCITSCAATASASRSRAAAWHRADAARIEMHSSGATVAGSTRSRRRARSTRTRPS
mmetsp:Transcript_29174/g.66912  ORF Transcript_29174/g.66912 Transcript_29174/m.66912 type:complete len:216 (+) Transcript_29174:1193-1840(+)